MFSIMNKYCKDLKLMQKLFSLRSNLTLCLVLKPWANDRNISTQHIPTLLAQKLQVPGKRSQHLNAIDSNIVWRNILHAFGHPVATCCDMLRVENRTSAHAQAQHCCTNLAKRLQHHATSKNVACMKNLTIFRFEPICRNMS